MKAGVYKLKPEYDYMPQDLREDLWYMIKSLIDNTPEGSLSNIHGKQLLDKYYNEPS